MGGRESTIVLRAKIEHDSVWEEERQRECMGGRESTIVYGRKIEHDSVWKEDRAR